MFCKHCGEEVHLTLRTGRQMVVHTATSSQVCAGARNVAEIGHRPPDGRTFAEQSAQDAYEEVLAAVWKAEEDWRFDDRLRLMGSRS